MPADGHAPTTSDAPSSREVVLRLVGLTKRFGSVSAVDGLDLEVRRGEVLGFLGPNGAGKSTTVGMILGLIAPTAGRVEYTALSLKRRLSRSPWNFAVAIR
jgi:ABC-2 type transport system ATP-binding protein